MISLSKRNTAILLLALVLFVMLPFGFTWKTSALEYIEEYPVSAVLFWIFYISIIATSLAALLNRYDISKLTSIISLIVIIVLHIQTLKTVLFKASFISILFGCTQFAYAYIAITVIIFFLVRKKD